MINDRAKADAATYSRRRLIVGAGLLGVPTLLYAWSRGSTKSLGADQPGSDPPTTVVSSVQPDVALTPPTTQAAQTTVGATSTTVAGWQPFDHEVAVGASGDKVRLVQDRLRQLGYDPGVTDGSFGSATERAVWAYEKLVLDVPVREVTGRVTPAVWERMNQTNEVRPRRSGPGTHLEILLDRQVAVLYVDDGTRLITHISSGTGDTWCAVVTVDQEDGSQTEEGICGVAVTPGGVFHFNRRVDGWRNSKLGRLYNPVYFNYGLAVHGASNVPNVPASHGCVRIPMHVAEYFPSLVSNGDYVYVFDGVEQPEIYGAQVPTFDYPDPNWIPPSTTTTATTTTTTATTTTTPRTTTTVPKTTTIHAPSATTTAQHPSATSTTHVDESTPSETSMLSPPVDG